MLSGRPLDKPLPKISARIAGRPPELEDWLNRNLYHRLSLPLARGLARTFVTPNMVSVAGGLMVVLAALVYVRFDSVAGAVCGLLLHMGWHVLDGADGDLARLTGKASEYGEMVDGLCDYAGHFVLYLCLGSVLAVQIGPAGWVLVVATGLVRIPHTVFYETQRRQYQWWVYGKEWLRISTGDAGPETRAFGGIVRFYMRLSQRLETGGRRLDAVIERAAGRERERIRAGIAEGFYPVFAPLSLLSSNYRTIGIGIAMILGSPGWYVAFELVFLTLLMLALMRRTGTAIARVCDQAEASTER